jgi:hypothetical protein
MLDRARVGDLVHSTADEQIAGQRARDGMVDHLVHLQLAVAGARLEEEVVCQVLDQVAGRENVVAIPGPPQRILRQRTLTSDGK